jgi:hypothetical protein
VYLCPYSLTTVNFWVMTQLFIHVRLSPVWKADNITLGILLHIFGVLGGTADVRRADICPETLLTGIEMIICYF